MNQNLAIVLPAYKSIYLEETIQCLCNQTDQRFKLYIFDDASPYNINEIVKKSSFNFPFKFKRFKNNLGSISLTKHWDRCINETENEEWIWLFSDDDIMSPDCVETFYKELDKNPGYPAYRFNTTKISSDGETLRENRFPKTFDGAQFLNRKLSYEEESYIVEYIFSRRAYQEIDGFIDLPLAWTADDLFCVKLAELGHICSMSNGTVKWRYSESNISGRQNRSKALLKLQAASEFVKWIMNHPKILQNLNPENLPMTWFIRQIKSMLNQLTLLDELKAVKSVAHYDNRVWKLYFHMKKNRSKTIGWLKKFSL